MPAAKKIEWYDMDESLYRASRICRAMGNPKSFHILALLKDLGQATPTELAPRINRSLPATSIALRPLRELDLVRYQRDGKNAIYRLKHKDVAGAMDTLEALVLRIRRQE